jgi:pimeloyl-ACP methyl ester carboxylesterase
MLKTLVKPFIALVILMTLIMVGWYRIDGIPLDTTTEFMTGDGFTVAREDDGALLFMPAVPNNQGIVIMHGALILPQSYAKSAAFFTSRGYTVYLPNGPGRMSIAATDRAAERIGELDLDGWFFIGHSMGGMASLDTIDSNNIPVKAVALWATAMPADFSHLQLPILYIWGDTDGLLPAERLRRSKANLPGSVEYITLEGANHKNFAMYSHQFFDSEATIDWMEQIDFANETTAEFFAKHQ